jgi:hypothetical protein
MQPISPEVQNFVFLVLSGLITFFTPIVLDEVRRFIAVQRANAKAKLTQAQWDQVTAWTDFLVKAAEQSDLTGAIVRTGQEKKQYVLGELQKLISGAGFNLVDVSKLGDLTESRLLDKVHEPLPVILASAETLKTGGSGS